MLEGNCKQHTSGIGKDLLHSVLLPHRGRWPVAKGKPPASWRWCNCDGQPLPLPRPQGRWCGGGLWSRTSCPSFSTFLHLISYCESEWCLCREWEDGWTVSVCVCVCVHERERERERLNFIKFSMTTTARTHWVLNYTEHLSNMLLMLR